MAPLRGSLAVPITPVTDRRAIGPAIQVYGLNADPSADVSAGPARPVVLISAADLAGNGGAYELSADTAYLPVVAVSDRVVEAGPAIAVYVAAGTLIPPVPALPPIIQNEGLLLEDGSGALGLESVNRLLLG